MKHCRVSSFFQLDPWPILAKNIAESSGSLSAGAISCSESCIAACSCSCQGQLGTDFYLHLASGKDRRSIVGPATWFSSA